MRPRRACSATRSASCGSSGSSSSSRTATRIGRQYIYRRGRQDDADYLEKDCFTSYSARRPPPSDRPRVGEVIFRLPHRDPQRIWRRLRAEGLVDPLGPANAEAAFRAGRSPRLLFRGPDTQRYELAPSAENAVENHAVFIWTHPAALEAALKAYAEEFDLERSTSSPVDFHGLGEATVLARDRAPVTVGLLTPHPGQALAPRLTDDIFAEVGYSHFRLGSPRKALCKARNREMFPDTGDVSYVLFHEAYLELVEIPQ